MRIIPPSVGLKPCLIPWKPEGLSCRKHGVSTPGNPDEQLTSIINPIRRAEALPYTMEALRASSRLPNGLSRIQRGGFNPGVSRDWLALFAWAILVLKPSRIVDISNPNNAYLANEFLWMVNKSLDCEDPSDRGSTSARLPREEYLF
jgi:hypothetical protein